MSIPPAVNDLAAMRPALFLIAMRALGDRALSEDVAQETIQRAIAAVQGGRLRDGHRLAPFVHAIARHVIMDTLAAKRRSSTDIVEVPDTSPDALAVLVREEDLDALRFAVRQLDPDELALLRMLYHDGLSSAEAAARLGEPGPRVRKRKSRLLERLRAFFHASRGHEHGRQPTTAADPSPRTAKSIP